MELRKLKSRLNYYKTLIKVNNSLTEQQQKKYDELTEIINNQVNAKTITEQEIVEHKKLMIERNKQHAKQRYYDNPKYCFGKLKFKNIKDAKNYFQLWLNQHGEDNNVELVELVELVKNHPIGFNEEKQHIEIHKNPTFDNNYNLVVVNNNDNKTVYLTLYSCITGKYKSNKHHLNDCLRRAIIEQINEFKETNSMPDKCAICHVELTPDNVEIDHVIPFSVLVDEWIKQNKVDIDTIEYEQVKGVRMIKDKELINDWVVYHKTHAKLEFICNECNVKKSNN